jgi:hypothetical protein
MVFLVIMFSLWGFSQLSLISYGLSMIASYLLIITLSILIACCSQLGPIYVIRVCYVNSI